MTSLVPQNQTVTVTDADTLGSVLMRLADTKVVAEAEKPSVTPKVIPLTETSKKAITRLSKDLGAAKLPSERRVMTEDEQASLILLGRDVKDAEKALKLATEAVKAAVFNHLDVRLEEDNDPIELPWDEKTGHYLVTGDLEVPDTGLRFCRELRQASPDVTADDLLALYDDGKITRDQYLKATRQVRVVNEEGLMGEIRKDPTILEALAEVIEPGKVTAAFVIRSVKKAE